MHFIVSSQLSLAKNWLWSIRNSYMTFNDMHFFNLSGNFITWESFFRFGINRVANDHGWCTEAMLHRNLLFMLIGCREDISISWRNQNQLSSFYFRWQTNLGNIFRHANSRQTNEIFWKIFSKQKNLKNHCLL